MSDYVQIGLLALTGSDTDKQPVMKDGKPVIFELEKVPDLFAKIGTNTQYILHVEEITAEHFAAMVSGDKMTDWSYVDGVKKAFANN